MNEKLPPADLYNETILIAEAVETIEQLCLIQERLSETDDFPVFQATAIRHAIEYAANRVRGGVEALEFSLRPKEDRHA